MGTLVTLLGVGPGLALADGGPEARFAGMDRDGNGRLSEDEAGIRQQQKLRLFWHSVDVNDDGQLSAWEFGRYERRLDAREETPAPQLPPSMRQR